MKKRRFAAIAAVPVLCILILLAGYKYRTEYARKDFAQFNDGKWAKSEDFKVSWTPDSVQVLVSGEEQEDALYILKFSTSNSSS